MSAVPNLSFAPKEKKIATCYHCGDECREETLHFEEKTFCCQGCKMVFEILNANDLCQYYQIDKNAGISLKGKRQERYSYLEETEVMRQLVDFQDDTRTKVTFHLPQIHCASCIWLLENLPKLNPGITASIVSFPKKEIRITFLHHVTSLRRIAELLASIGYAPAIHLGQLKKEKTQPVSRIFYYQIGVAGFAFGNIMLLSFPEYLGLDGSDAFFQKLFGYLNILLAIPVAFFSGKDYFISAWGSLRKGYLNLDVPIALGIVALFGRSVFEILTHTGAGYMDSLAGLIFFLLTGRWFQQKTYHHLSFERDYKSYFPVAATIFKDQKEETVSLDRLTIGDTILIRHGELIPADGILLKGKASVDYSFVTGEAELVEKHSGDQLFAGGKQVGESIEISLTKAVSQSYLTQLWNDASFQQEEKPYASRLADAIGKRFTIVVLVVSFGALFYWLPRDTSTAINAFTAVLIIACPCAVALSIPFTLGNLLRIFGKNGFYLKNTQVIEDLNQFSTVVFDKTGTLTTVFQNRVTFDGETLTTLQKRKIRSLARQSAHPLSRQLASYLADGTEDFGVKDFLEIEGKGIQGRVGDGWVRAGSLAFISGETGSSKNGSEVFVEIEGKVIGGFRFLNQYRRGLDALLEFFQQRYPTYLLSGDNDRERPFLTGKFQNPGALHFDQSPQDKLDFVKNLQKNGARVLMIGDGLNDAGALKSSYVGVVLTEDSNNFTPACDAILDSRQFENLPKFVKTARSGVRLVHYAYFLAFCYNIVGLSYAVTGNLSPVVAAILMPLSSVTIVIFGVFGSNLLARMNGVFSTDKSHLTT